jgi:hypothetical protein
MGIAQHLRNWFEGALSTVVSLSYPMKMIGLFSRLRGSAALLLCSAALAHAGTFTAAPLLGDADSGINTGLVYTATADYLGTGTRVVNGVTFTDTATAGTNYALSGATDELRDFVNNTTGGINGLLSDFYFTGNGTGNAQLTLTGLTIGTEYVTTWYNAGFGGVGGRNIHITPSDTGTTFTFDQNYSGASNGSMLRYTFVATSDTMTYSFDADGNNDSFHHYAMTNAVMNRSLLSTPVVTQATGPGPFTPFQVRNDDLLQTSLLDFTSTGNFTLEGGGGVPALFNGAFQINGGNPTDNSQLATGENGASITFNLDTTTNALGYDITSFDSYGGWNDSGRDRQKFELYYSKVGSSDFTFLGSIDYDPTGAPTDPSAVRAMFGTALTGVDAIRVDFPATQENNYAGYGEFDLIGKATVPEPATGIMLLAGAVGLMRRRRSS